LNKTFSNLEHLKEDRRMSIQKSKSNNNYICHSVHRDIINEHKNNKINASLKDRRQSM